MTANTTPGSWAARAETARLLASAFNRAIAGALDAVQLVGVVERHVSHLTAKVERAPLDRDVVTVEARHALLSECVRLARIVAVALDAADVGVLAVDLAEEYAQDCARELIATAHFLALNCTANTTREMN